jgi:hypothetical protein
LVLAKQNNRVYGALLQSVQGIAFFATPHRGGNGVTLGDVVARTASFVLGSGQNDMVRNLRTGSKALAQLSADFSHQYEDFQFLSVIESVDLIQAPMNPIRTASLPQLLDVHLVPNALFQLIVDRASAELGLPGHRERVVELQRDHSQICKFEAEEHGFKRVIKHLRKMAHDACGGSASIAPSTIPISLADGVCISYPVACSGHLPYNARMLTGKSSR